MKLENFETYAVEGIDGGGLKRDGVVVFAPVPPEAVDAPESAKQVSEFLALLNELVEQTEGIEE